MPNTPKKNRTDANVADQRLIDGLQKHAATITSLVIAGVAMTPTDIIGTLQARIASSAVSTTTRAAFRAAVAAEKDERAKTKALVSAVRQALMVAFAGQIDTLSDFGLAPRKVPVLTPDQKLAAAKKAKATREARHTLGKVQKSKITGDNPTGAPAVAPSPVTAAPAPAPNPAPVAPPATAPVNAGPAPAAAPVVTPVTPVAPVPAPAPAVAPTQNTKS